MASDLCGPSNALQTLQKNSSVDRSLQQDRLTSRRAPFEGFRSADPNAGILDPEFQAFQASQPAPLHFSGAGPLTETPLFGSRGRQPVFNDPEVSNDWASDFQRLQISPSPFGQHAQVQAREAHLSPAQIPFHDAPSAQHQRGMFESPLSHVPQYSGPHMMQQPQPWAGAPLFAGGPLQQGAVEQQLDDRFDDAAFESAFEAAGRNAATEETLVEMDDESEGSFDAEFDPMSHHPHIPLLTINFSRATLEPTPADMHLAALNMSLLEEIDSARITADGFLFFTLMKFCGPVGLPFADTYRLAERARSFLLKHYSSFGDFAGDLHVEDQVLPARPTEGVTATDEELRADIDQQLNSLKSRDFAERVLEALPLDLYDNIGRSNAQGVWRAWWGLLNKQVQDGMAAQQREARSSEPIAQIPSAQSRAEEDAQPKQELSGPNQNDELARTAADLLLKVENNQSEKFQNSAFLGLMRKLRDGEVRVEGDQVVETGQSVPPAQQQNSTYRAEVPPLELRRPDAAARPAGVESADVQAQQRLDGQEVVDLLGQPGAAVQERPPGVDGIQPFYDNAHAELGRRGLWQE